jgi:large conductance mechanosensitive channel
VLKEFREFALKGNVVDLAVGIIIGAAFGKIVESLVGDLIMPVIGALTGGLDFSNHFTPLTYGVSASSLAEARKEGAVLAWGNFITIAINFVIIAFAMFLLVKVIHGVRRREEAKPAPAAEVPPDVKLLTEIRDLLAQR